MTAEATDSVVFIGPSVDRATVKQHFWGTVHPPVRRGDIEALLGGARRPRSIGIVDGCFLQSLAVSPKEILRAIDAGVTVIGGASMGALRAVECEPFGMYGVGEIFGMYVAGDLDADDEVAITFDPETLRATSEPMVNIRMAMRHAVATRRLDAATALAVQQTGKGMYFPDRTYANIGHMVKDRISREQLAQYRAYVTSPDRLDQKRADAIDLLDLIAER